MDGLAVGRIVHYVGVVHDYSSGQRYDRPNCAAAVVIRVPAAHEDGIADLQVFTPSGDMVWQPDVCHADVTLVGTWHWPERA